MALLELLPSLAASLSGMPLLKADLPVAHERCYFDRSDNAFDIVAHDNIYMALLFESEILATLSIMCMACLCG